MLFSIFKVNKILPNVSIRKMLGEYCIETSKKDNYTSFNINWKDDKEVQNINGLYFSHKIETLILAETFSKPFKTITKAVLSEAFDSEVSEYHFSFDMGNLLKSFDNITEMRLRTSDPLIEEINIVGEDLEDSETFDFYMESEIIYFASFDKNFSASMRIFEDGRISIIPEMDYKSVVSFLTSVLEKLQ